MISNKFAVHVSYTCGALSVQLFAHAELWSWTFYCSCLISCQSNKGVRQPEVKQHTFPYCNHMAVCQSLCTALSTASLLPHITHAQKLICLTM